MKEGGGIGKRRGRGSDLPLLYLFVFCFVSFLFSCCWEGRGGVGGREGENKTKITPKTPLVSRITA